ncbi:MAG: PH domain-containing protein [Prevotella sp.]|nr:PH domain-containing protein [Prevotella sp.]MCH3992333.1 PH domain-containing protein [Prevotella sp.]MCH4017081.1 PH domain-containing protein [Prevotella sp.]MCH4099998.1 PH domain-containing protein [Prevotella sp.]MCH4185627.1 PH domain-containing protein [Prevotella sp.]
MDKTFHHRFTIGAMSGIVLFSILTFYFFWEKHALIGTLLMVLILCMIERVIHTTYTFHKVGAGTPGKEQEILIINKGRFSINKSIPLRELQEVTRMKTVFGLNHYLLLVYGSGKRMEAVMPVEEEGFLSELKKRCVSQER